MPLSSIRRIARALLAAAAIISVFLALEATLMVVVNRNHPSFIFMRLAYDVEDLLYLWSEDLRWIVIVGYTLVAISAAGRLGLAIAKNDDSRWLATLKVTLLFGILSMIVPGFLSSIARPNGFIAILAIVFFYALRM